MKVSAELCPMTITETTLADVVRVLIKERALNQSEVARRINTSVSNFNDRLRRNSFTPAMIEKLSELLKTDIVVVHRKMKQGVSLNDAMEMAEIQSNSTPGKMVIELSPEEVKELLINQARTNQQQQQEIQKLMDKIEKLLAKDSSES